MAEQTRERLRLAAVQQAQEQHRRLLEQRKNDVRQTPQEVIQEIPDLGQEVEKVYVKALYDYPGHEAGHLSFAVVGVCFLLQLILNPG